MKSKMGRAAADGFEKGSRRDRARHYHFRALRYATDMKQPFLLALAAAALLHVVSASADHPSRHDQAARTLDRMGAGGHGLRAYVRGVICVCGPLERVVRCEPKSQTLTSNTCFRVRCTRPMKDGRCRRRGTTTMRHTRYRRLLPTYHQSKAHTSVRVASQCGPRSSKTHRTLLRARCEPALRDGMRLGCICLHPLPHAGQFQPML